MPNDSGARAAFGFRAAAAREINAAAESVAIRVTDEFLRRHPAWVERYGDTGRRKGVEDARHHLDFLGSAIEAGSSVSFCDYTRWCSRLLSGYDIAPPFLAEVLLLIREALTDKVTPPSHQLVGTYIHAAVACLDDEAAPLPPLSSPFDATRSVFVQAVLSGRRKEAVVIAREAFRVELPRAAVYVGVFQAALYEIGALWEARRITVAQEHMATATVQYVLAQIYAELPLAARRLGNAIITGVEGELHQLGANIVADMLEAEGWNVRFLGTNMPHAGIIAAVEEHQATLLGISATMLPNLPRVRSLVEEVRASLGARAPRIMVGGGAFRSSAAFCDELAVEGPGLDVADALRLCAA